MRRGEYEVPIQNVERVVDLGANIGMASLYFLWKYPDATVDAYEIDPDNVVYLTKNLQQFPHARVHSMGVAAQAGEFTLYQRAEGGSSASSLIPEGDMRKGPLVKTQSLDTIIGERTIDILKIDIEGSEFEVLQASKKLSQVRVIIAELEAKKVGHTNQDILDILMPTHMVSMRGPIMTAIRKDEI